MAALVACKSNSKVLQHKHIKIEYLVYCYSRGELDRLQCEVYLYGLLKIYISFYVKDEPVSLFLLPSFSLFALLFPSL
jgi:hypothetical protein